VFYAGLESFLDQLVPFVREGVAQGEPTLVVLAAPRLAALREALGPDADSVQFADMDDVGANPALIIPAWQEFVAANQGRPVRGIGEPIFPERGPAELAECQHHERLLNPALAGSDLLLVCPYDTDALPADVIAEAQRSHPLVHHGGGEVANPSYDELESRAGLSGDPLPEPTVSAAPVEFDLDTLPAARAFVRQRAGEAGLATSRTEQLVLAVGEFTSNSVRHGGGGGTLRVWAERDRVICEVRDSGRIHDPLLDRTRPEDGAVGGWGLWVANQVCDLVQLRSLSTGVVARLHMQIP
jgi:anti-sigma regulatory factor (Ser/Thr protein kinase)